MYSHKNQMIAIVISESKFRADLDGRNREYQYSYENSRKATASITNASLIILNETVLTTYVGAGTFYAFYSGIQIGARANANGSFQNYGLVGELYQIRVYDRQLSEAEILFNQAIDIAKYHIQV